MRRVYFVTIIIFFTQHVFGIESDIWTRQMGANARQVLAQSLEVVPGDLEVILSYVGFGNGYGDVDNKFGHIAIRIGDFVYTANQHAKLGEDEELFYRTTHANYFYGKKSETKNAEAGSNYAVAYARNSYGLRTEGFSEQLIQNMLDEIESINSQWKQGLIQFHWRTKNCAHLTEQILAAGGIKLNYAIKTSFLPKFPLQIFQKYMQVLPQHSHLKVLGIRYQRIEGGMPNTPANLPPLNLYHPIHTLRQLLHPTTDLWAKIELSHLQQLAGEDLTFVPVESSCKSILQLAAN